MRTTCPRRTAAAHLGTLHRVDITDAAAVIEAPTKLDAKELEEPTAEELDEMQRWKDLEAPFEKKPSP